MATLMGQWLVAYQATFGKTEGKFGDDLAIAALVG